MTAYKVKRLKPQLIYVRWERNGDTADENQFIHDLKTLLDEAEDAIYFISDLREGRIIGMRTIHQLGRLTEHEMWAGSTAFSENPISRLFASSFEQATSAHDTNTVYHQPKDAIAFLEALSPGITEDIDWEIVLNDDDA